MGKDVICYVEGKFVPVNEAGLPVNDLGIQRGYGIFDFLRVSGNTPLFIEDHLQRFKHSAAVMRLDEALDIEHLKQIVDRLIKENQFDHSGMRFILTGGDSTDGYTIGKPRLTVIQQSLSKPPETLPQQGIHLVTHAYQRQIPEVKTTDYLMAIWLQPWMKEQGAQDILYHHQGNISECPRSNIFIITQENMLITPETNMLKGITRKQILSLADQLGIQVETRDVLLQECFQAKEVFISSSTKRLLPVEMIDHKKIGDGTKSTTQQIWNAFYELEMSLLK